MIGVKKNHVRKQSKDILANSEYPSEILCSIYPVMITGNQRNGVLLEPNFLMKIYSEDDHAKVFATGRNEFKNVWCLLTKWTMPVIYCDACALLMSEIL